MSGFSIFMLIFGILIFIAGLYIYTGHNSEVLIWKAYKKDATKKELEQIGKWVMIASLIPIIFAILGVFWNL